MSCIPSMQYNDRCATFYACVVISVGVICGAFSIIFTMPENQNLVTWAVGMICTVVGWWAPNPSIKADDTATKSILPT